MAETEPVTWSMTLTSICSLISIDQVITKPVAHTAFPGYLADAHWNRISTCAPSFRQPPVTVSNDLLFCAQLRRSSFAGSLPAFRGQTAYWISLTYDKFSLILQS